MLLMTFYTLLIIISFVMKAVKVVKDSEKVVFVSCFNFNLVKKVVYFFAAFFCVGIKIFVGFFLNKKLVSLLIIFLNIVLKMDR